MKIILTGATGFLGSYLLKEIKKDGHDVVILKRTTSKTNRIQDILPECRCYDIDCDSIEHIFTTEKPNAIIHCATVYSKDNKSIEQVIEGNMVFPIKILESAIKNKCRFFLNTDTFFSKQLPERLNKGKALYLPDYTLTKHQFHEWGKLKAIEGKITFINLQLEHIYGSGDSDGKFIKWLEEQFLERVPYINLTDGIQLRDFIHVLDVVKVYINILRNIEDYQGYYNIEVGTGKTMSLRQFIENIKEEMSAQTELRFGAVKRKKEEIMYSTASKTIVHFPADKDE